MDLLKTEMESENLAHLFNWPEYLVFGVVLALSMAIGVFYGFCHTQTNEEFLMAGRQMSVFPVTLSIICSFISALTFLGIPLEVYLYGVVTSSIMLTGIPLSLAIAYVYLPVFYELQLTSAYQYVEYRFSRPARLVISVTAIIHLLLYMPLTIWGPSLALDQVAGIDKYWTSIIIFLVCIAYSSMGGLKAVVWSDVLQGIIMFAAMFTIIIFGVNEVGGIGVVWEKASLGGRLNFDNFDPDYRTRYSGWTGLFGGFFIWLQLYCATQAQIQRYLSVRTFSDSKKCMFYNMAGLFLINILCGFIGLILFAKYHDCDPISTKKVMSGDQLLPFFVMDVLGKIPGLPGLMVAGITCGSLSSVSSALNALPAIIVEDFVKPWYPNLSDKQLSLASKIISLVGGLISFALIFVIANVGGIFSFAYQVHGTFLGPIVGIFTLGMFFPWANAWVKVLNKKDREDEGSMLGIIPSLAITLFIGIGSVVAGNAGRLPNQKLPLDTFCFQNQSAGNFDFIRRPNLDWKMQELEGVDKIFGMSYQWLAGITTISTVVFGLIFSLLINTFRSKSAKIQKVNSKYLSPPILQLWNLVLPTKLVEDWVDFDVKQSKTSSIKI